MRGVIKIAFGAVLTWPLPMASYLPLLK